MRVDLPNRIYDPKKGAALYDRFIEEWQVAEDEGLEIMLNEHHQTATCVDPAGPPAGGAGAGDQESAAPDPRQSGRQPPPAGARGRGNGDRRHPVARPRSRSVSCAACRIEILPANTNPVYTNERHWEALDLIMKAWTTTTGRSATRAASSILGASTSGRGPISSRIRRSGSARRPDGAARVGARGFVQATFLTGYHTTKPSSKPIAAGGAKPAAAKKSPIDRLAYAALVIRQQRSDGHAPAPKNSSGTSPSNKVPPHFANPPGYVLDQAGAPRAQKSASRASKAPTVEAAVEQGIMFAGTPDQVLRQFEKFYDRVGGFGHLLVARPIGLEPTKRPCTASRCWRARCSPGCGSATRTPPISGLFRETAPA